MNIEPRIAFAVCDGNVSQYTNLNAAWSQPCMFESYTTLLCTLTQTHFYNFHRYESKDIQIKSIN